MTDATIAHMRKALLCCLVVLSLGAISCRSLTTGGAIPEVEAGRYYAVLLTNGSVYFGQLEGLGTAYPVLKDVYYVQSNVNQETKAVSNSLVKRGKEWHEPDRMILNEKAIVFLEPVGKNSRVAQLIEQSKK
jgi:hypothetical protein